MNSRAHRSRLRWPPAVLAAVAFSFCAIPALAAPTSTATTPPMRVIPLPQATLDPDVDAAIVVSNPPADTPVTAGQVVDTPCFSTIAPLQGLAHIDGCRLDLYDQKKSTTPNELPYFSAKVEPVKYASLMAAERGALSVLVNDQGDPTTKLDGYPYLGAHREMIFGFLPSIQMAWGLDSRAKGVRVEESSIYVLIPRNRYVQDGKSLTTLVLQGFTIGPNPDAMPSAVIHFAMK